MNLQIIKYFAKKLEILLEKVSSFRKNIKEICLNWEKLIGF